MSKAGARLTLDQAKKLALRQAQAGNTGLLEQLGMIKPPGACVGGAVAGVLAPKGGEIAKLPKKREMSRSELLMEAKLRTAVRDGEIRGFEYEAIKLKVGEPTCWYMPDFAVEYNEGHPRICFIECKGKKVWEDSVIKFKAAKKQYPQFDFEMWQVKSHGYLERIL